MRIKTEEGGTVVLRAAWEYDRGDSLRKLEAEGQWWGEGACLNTKQMRRLARLLIKTADEIELKAGRR